VKGVSLGTLRGAAIEALGKPSSTASGRDTEMGQGSTLELAYPGLIVDLCEAGRRQSEKTPKDLHVWRMTVTGKAWEVSPGARVGMSRPEIEAILGVPNSVDTRGEEQVLHYSPFQFDAWLTVTLKAGVVVQVQMVEDWS
jgi:hypothetical protein